MLERYFSLIIAALLPLLMYGWFAPTPIGQIDFWLLWVVAMMCVGLPLLFAEVGLSYRSGQAPLKGMQTLTREADTSVMWRSFAWLSVFGALLLAALSLDLVSVKVLQTMSEMGAGFYLPKLALAIVMIVIAIFLSLLKRVTALIGLAAISIALVIATFTQFESVSFSMTDISLEEWARAVILALVSIGVGTGIYWFNIPAINSDTLNKKSLAQNAVDSPKIAPKTNIATDTTKVNVARIVLSIWLTQLIAGGFAFILTSANLPPFANILYAVGVLAVSSYLLYYALRQLADKFGNWMAFSMVVIVTVSLVAIATPKFLTILLVLLSLSASILLAVFTGWQMKISHMRKSLNFRSEGVYNLWRVAIRLLTPLMIIAALIGWVQYWIA